MNTPILYRGVWPQNVNKLAKYGVRFVDGEWKITVLYEIGVGLRYLAVEGDGAELVSQINGVKTALRGQPGGAFYVNEYRHVIVPVSLSPGETPGYYYAGLLKGSFVFEFEGKPLTTKPQRADGTPLKPGERWVGPRPGIPYVLAAGAGDIYYETPALTDDDPPALRPGVTKKVQLSKILGDRSKVACAVRPIAGQRGHQGGRFYVNEHGAMFTPVDGGEGNGIDYIFCGEIDRSAWFPEPRVND